MSIASEISRLTQAKAEIKTAIEGKGVTVPSLAKLDDYPDYIDDIPGGITPTGNINITDTQVTDVSAYATAQVVDSDLIAENIKKDVNILGVVGSYEGSGGGSLQFASTYVRGSSSSILNFTGLPAEPKVFTVMGYTFSPITSSSHVVVATHYDGSMQLGEMNEITISASAFSNNWSCLWNYSGGTLTLQSSVASFSLTRYYLYYGY